MDCTCSLSSEYKGNYAVLYSIWHEASDVSKQSEMKARINGVAAEMKEFNFLFGLMNPEKLLKHSNNVSWTIQATSMPKKAIVSQVCALKSCSI